MKITEKELIQIINEEIRIVIENDDIDEGVLDQLKAKASGALSSAGSAIAGKIPGGGAAASEMATNAKLKQASSIMKSYAKHMQKLKLKLDADVTKLGIADIDNIKKVSQSIEQARATTQETAENAPRDEKFRRAVAAAVEQQAGGAQPAAASPAPTASPTPATAPATTPAAAASPEPAATTPAPTADAAPTPAATAEPAATEPAAAEPAAAPAAAEPAAAATAPAAAPGADQAKKDARNLKDRERRAQKKATAAADREKKDRRNTRQRERRASDAASAVPSAAASGMNERKKLSKGETLNEQLQKISKRWGFGK